MTINVLQLTDLHLFADTAQQLKNVNTEQTFSQVLAAVAADEKKPDIVLLTGDLTQLGEVVAYQRLLIHCQQFACPVYAIPGNHDDVTVQQHVFNESNISMQKSFLQQGWHFVLLNSVIPRHCEGALSQSELNFLQTALTRHAKVPTLITLHHHVQSVQSDMDTMMLTNADEFLKVIAAHKNVRVVLYGHVHQEFDQIFNEVRYLASPATCLQIKIGTAEFSETNKLHPGYRWLELHDDATINTEVVRVK